MQGRAVGAAVAVLVLVAASAGCGSDPDLRPGKAVAAVAIDNVFNAAKPVRIAVGDTVVWKNLGHNDHDVVPIGAAPADGAFGVGADAFTPGQSYAHRFGTAGAFRYYCSLHGNPRGGMSGVVLVGGVADPTVTDQATDQERGASGRTLDVPADEPTIQQAVDSAGPGDLILVAPGVYKEAVEVTDDKDDITIRGLDRDKTILDGEFTRANGVQIVKADGVVVENLTVRNYTKNGVFWTGSDGYRGSYLNAYRNGDYGVYAFESTDGQFDHSYASGSPDAGFYIGGCHPCNAVIDHVMSEWNGLGYSGTNAGGDLFIVSSTFRFNRAGVVPNSGSYEPHAPERDDTIVGNVVYDNNNGKTPAIDISITAMGNGILVAGGSGNVIERNLVVDHDLGGIVVITYPETAEYVWDAADNVVRGNVVRSSGLGDLALWVDGTGTKTGGNCFADNDFHTSAPLRIEQAVPCDGAGTGDLTQGAFDLARLATNEGKPASVPYDRAAIPAIPDQDELPDAATAEAEPMVDGPAQVDLDALTVPPLSALGGR